MTKSINKRTLSFILSVAMLFSIFSGLVLRASAENTVAGKWSGSTTAANGTVYSLELTLEANGDYTLVTSYAMGEDTYKETENGTYAVTDGKIAFTGDKLVVEAMEATYSADNTSGTVSGDTMTVTRHASFMAKSMGKDAVKITLKQTEKAVTYDDNLKSGKYELTADDYDASAMMKMPMLFTIDTEAKTFNTQDPREGKDLAAKGFGTYTFDELTGIYTVTYTKDTAEGATVQFTYSDGAIKFVTPAYFGKAKMDIRDENDNFLPYTAHAVKEQAKYTDDLKAGKYELTADDYDASAMMKMPMLFTIDTEAKTFNTQDPREGKDLAAKGYGTYSFDELTGIYTVTYTKDTAEGATAQFTYSDGAITFVTPAYFGKARMDIRDENDNFLPYTAHAVKEQGNTSEFKEGRYVGEYNKTAMSGVKIKYEISAVFAGGKYSYDVKVSLSNGEYDNSDPTKAGTYTHSGSSLSFDKDSCLENAEITGEGKLRIYGTLSSFSFAPDYAELVWTEEADPSEADDIDKKNIYAVTDGTEREYKTGSKEDMTFVCEGEFDKFTDIRFDGVVLEKNCYNAVSGSTKVTVSGEYLESLADGMHSILLVYTDGESETIKLRKASAEGTYEDKLTSGDYELKLEDFDDRAGVHRHPCIITIDREKGTFIVHETGDTETDKGSGTISFDSATGEYTMKYTAGGPETQNDPTSTFRYENGLAFTSALKLGRSAMNVTDEDGRFIPYTAKPVASEASSPADDSNAPQTGTAASKALIVFSAAAVLMLLGRKKK